MASCLHTSPSRIKQIRIEHADGDGDIIDAKKMDEYGKNLANLIRDVRKDLDAQKLPFIIGELGQQGTSSNYTFCHLTALTTTRSNERGKTSTTTSPATSVERA